MKIRNLPDGSLTLEESFRVLRALCLACAVVALLLFVAVWLGDYGETADAGWAAFEVAVLCLAGTLVNDRGFRFDVAGQTVTWRQANLFRSKQGRIPFSDIRDVVVSGERSRDDDTSVGGQTVRFRLMLVTATGNFPLSSFHSRRERDFRELAGKVRDVLALAGPDTQELTTAGRTTPGDRRF